jgi:outer membrane protein assembly factor BamE
MSRLILFLLLVPMLSGCNLLYKVEVQQGNPLSAESLAGLKPGMTKRQVQLLLGSPSVNDVFHPDRWDYVHTVARAGEPIKPPPHLTLYFQNDALVSASGELAPATLPRSVTPATAPAP